MFGKKRGNNKKVKICSLVSRNHVTLTKLERAKLLKDN